MPFGFGSNKREKEPLFNTHLIDASFSVSFSFIILWRICQEIARIGGIVPINRGSNLPSTSILVIG
jgi:hypothetical protein